MSTALQCPDCGQKHPLGTLGDQVVFPCSRCSRPLKVPAAYRPGASAAAGTGGSNGASRPAGSRPAKKRTRAGDSHSMPVRILLWVVAFALGAFVVRMIAKWTGFVGGNTLVDLLIDHSFGNYFKLFVLVPFWALFSTLFLTAFLEGPAWIRRRRAGVPMGPPSRTARAGAAGAAAAGAATATKTAATKAGAKAGARSATGTIPKRVPATATAAAAGAAAGAVTRPRAIPRRGETPAPAPEPVPAPVPDDRTQALAAVVPAAAPEPEPEDEYAAKAAAGHRPRRIPRRDTGS